MAAPEPHPRLHERVVRASSHRAKRAEVSARGWLERQPWADRIYRALYLYYGRSIGRQATVVTYAAYFLAFPLLVIYLKVLAILFTASPRTAQFVVQMLELDPSTDLSNVVGTMFATSLDAFWALVGVIGVVLASAATASNLRSGVDVIFGLTSPRRSLLRAPALDFSAGLWLAVAVLASWILALGTLVRRGAFADVVGTRPPWYLMFGIKYGSLLLSVAIIAFIFDRALARVRRTTDHINRNTRFIGALVAALVVVVSNYLFLFFTAWILSEPDGGGGFTLALNLLLYVSVVVRGVMLVLCWMAVDLSQDDALL